MSYGLVGLSRTRSSSDSSRAIHGVVGGRLGRVVQIVQREEADQLAHRLQALGLGVVDEVRDAGGPAVDVGSAQRVEAHFLVGHSLHHVGAGDEHVATPRTMNTKSVIAGL